MLYLYLGFDGCMEATYASESAAAIITMVFQHTDNGCKLEIFSPFGFFWSRSYTKLELLTFLRNEMRGYTVCAEINWKWCNQKEIHTPKTEVGKT